jgi:hypothetical protein
MALVISSARSGVRGRLPTNLSCISWHSCARFTCRWNCSSALSRGLAQPARIDNPVKAVMSHAVKQGPSCSYCCDPRSVSGPANPSGSALRRWSPIEGTMPKTAKRKYSKVPGATLKARCTVTSGAQPKAGPAGRQGQEPQASDRHRAVESPKEGQEGPEQEVVVATPVAFHWSFCLE